MNFTTECDVVTVAQGSPYTYDFENETPWNCWTNVAGSNVRNTGDNNTTGGSYKLQFQGTTTGNIVAMPGFTPDINGLMLTFWTRPESYNYSYCGTFSVGYMTDLTDASSFVAVDTYSYNDWTVNSYLEKKVAFTNAPAGAYIAFRHNAGAGNYYWFVDDVTVELVPSFTKDIIGYGTSTGGYYLIASPVANATTPTADNGFLTEAYDLYSFDQAEQLEWRNYKAQSFDIVNGQGYLYASQANTTLTFNGMPYSGNGEVELTKADGVSFEGWNLVGNPFAETAYLLVDHYTMNGEGNEIVASEGNSVEAMEGVFVVAENDGDVVTFSTEAPAGRGSSLVMNLSRNTRGTAIDRVILSFGGGRQLPKFQLRETSTKIYVPQVDGNYAIVSAESDMGELPVSFKAESDGTYTLSFKTDNVEFNYLHLIDNMTGNEVDLLSMPYYSFDALTTDYASRFKLVFATGGNSEDNLAFFSNGSFVISNEGEAMLQVVDVTGRILKSEQINGSANVSVNAAPGVYMLRLVNGSDVKVQKVVVK